MIIDIHRKRAASGQSGGFNLSSNNKKLTGAAIIVMASLVVSRITGYLRTILINNLLTAAQSIHCWQRSEPLT